MKKKHFEDTMLTWDLKKYSMTRFKNRSFHLNLGIWQVCRNKKIKIDSYKTIMHCILMIYILKIRFLFKLKNVNFHLRLVGLSYKSCSKECIPLKKV